jgi:three-Cys-motif partner protein
MSEFEYEFFEGKREWSLLKDTVIGHYLEPYLKKIKELNKKIILVDSFAGPGVFADGSKGSPLIICESAEKYLLGNYEVYLINKNPDHHTELSQNLKKYIDSGKVHTINTPADEFLLSLAKHITDEVVFIYLDPFGVVGIEYASILPFLNRSKSYSTELIINLSVPTILRLSCVDSFSAKGFTPEIISKHNTLTKVFGGDYWKNFLLNSAADTYERIEELLEVYKGKLEEYYKYVGYCPVYATDERSKMKYCIFFVSRHQDAKFLMNDIMATAYKKHIWNFMVKDTLFGEMEMEPEQMHASYFEKLEELILEEVGHSRFSRIEIWSKFVYKYFMKYTRSDFNKSIKNLVIKKKLRIAPLGKLNNDTILYKL